MTDQPSEKSVEVPVDMARGVMLDYLVARLAFPEKALFFNGDNECYVLIKKEPKPQLLNFQPSRKWQHGGMIMDKNNIDSIYFNDESDKKDEGTMFLSYSLKDCNVVAYGKTRLEAAMRAFVKCGIEGTDRSKVILSSHEFLGKKEKWEEKFKINEKIVNETSVAE